MLKTLAFLLATATASMGVAAAAPSTGAPAAASSPLLPGIFGRFLASSAHPTRVAEAPNAADVLAGVQKFYAGIQHVSAKFRQEVKNSTFGRSDVSDGRLWIAKPGKMRWDYLAKKTKKTKTTVAKSFISNGNYLYVVDNENKQVIKKDLEKNLLPTAVTFLYGKGDLAADFTPALDNTGTYGAKTDYVLALTPKQSSAQYKMLYLVVDPSNYRVKESIIVDGAGNTNHFRFYEPDFDATVKDSWFEFNEKAVKTYRIIDGDAAAAPDGPDQDAPAR
ncbi:MAG TPA: outer membrane lipoprotein carrier protein LolA [Kofleriaceae bacterium]|nr:outer membrane lipoprotein carrier protein LolA [Kofleriaceae bacterium]